MAVRMVRPSPQPSALRLEPKRRPWRAARPTIAAAGVAKSCSPSTAFACTREIFCSRPSSSRPNQRSRSSSASALLGYTHTRPAAISTG